MLLTDPPYNVDYEGKTKDKLKIENDKKDDASFFEFLSDAFENAAEALKPGGGGANGVENCVVKALSDSQQKSLWVKVFNYTLT